MATLAVVLLIEVTAREHLVELPLIDRAIPTELLASVLVPALVAIPLHDAFPGLSATLAREYTQRFARAALAAALALATMAPTLVGGRDLRAQFAYEDVRLAQSVFWLLLSIGVIAVVVAGQIAPLIVLGSGFFLLVMTAAPTSAPATFLLACPQYAGVLLASCAFHWYGIRGPLSRPRDAEID